MKKFTVIFICVSLFLRIDIFSQEGCGTLVSSEQVQLETTFTDSISEIINLGKTIYISAHIVENEDGLAGIDESAINGVINGLNQIFETIGLRFQLLKTNIIENYNFNSLDYSSTVQELADISSVDNTINIYFVDYLYDISGGAVCAFTFMPADNMDLMFFNKTCFSTTVFAEQMGHFFNLYHTHETAFGIENANQSNCKNSGDLCCDTYADPNLKDLVSDECEYEGVKKDPQNNFYSPSVKNYMSSSEQVCKCFFSEEQYIRIINAVLKLKGYLL